jgi:bis(5'-nucleosidyl)-tetraphosphatase
MMKHIYSAGVIVFCEKDGQRLYLLLRTRSGFWDLAKGKIEGGETLQQAALRELKEESGLDSIELLPGFQEMLVYSFVDQESQPVYKTVYFFVGKAAADAHVILSKEHSDFVWLPFHEAINRLTYQTARDMVTKAHNFIG